MAKVRDALFPVRFLKNVDNLPRQARDKQKRNENSSKRIAFYTGERGNNPVQWAGVAINGRVARVTAEGRIPEGLLAPVYVECDEEEAGSARVTLGPLTAAFAVMDRGEE
eukprot:COSAG06_NODE_1580_length_9031_cov_6.088894_10_plen_110_part_00